MKMRMGKLRVQSREKIEMEGLGREEGEGEKGSQVLKGVVVWINGWTGEFLSWAALLRRRTDGLSFSHLLFTFLIPLSTFSIIAQLG